MIISNLYSYSNNSQNSPDLGEHNPIAVNAKIIEYCVSTKEHYEHTHIDWNQDETLT